MSIRLTFCTLAIACSLQMMGQTEAPVVQHAPPAFHRSFSNYVRANQNRKLQGFRVQVFNGHRSEANQWKTKFLQAYPQMECMVIFETPDYKLQVGNYRTMYEAQSALSTIRKEFPGAFIVETAIQPPALPRVESADEESSETPTNEATPKREASSSERVNEE